MGKESEAKLLKFSGLLTSKITFSDWIYLFENRCVAKGAAIADYVFRRVDTLPTTLTLTAQKYAECKADLVSVIQDDALQLVKALPQDQQGCRETVAAMITEYRGQAPSTRHLAIGKLVTEKHNPDSGESIEQFCHKKRTLMVEDLGNKIDPAELLNSSITGGLSQDYDVVTNRILSQPVGHAATPYNDLVRQLKEQEKLNASRRDEVDTAQSTAIANKSEAFSLNDVKAVVAAAIAGASWNGKGKGKGKGKNSWNNNNTFTGKCNKCGIKGHKGFECRKKVADKVVKKDQKNKK